MTIRAKYVREGLLYTRSELKRILEFSDDESLNECLKQLKKYRILKTKRYKQYDEDESLIEDEDEDYIENGIYSDEMKYLFRFVGIVCCVDRIINVYPKYIESSCEPKEAMEQVLHVLLKYKKHWERDFYAFADEGEKEKINILSLMLFLLSDYSEHGLYQNEERILEINGDGRIEWQHTVDEMIPIINSNKPYYVELITEKMVNNERDFIYRLHAAILSECSNQLQEAELTSVFSVPRLELSDESIDSFGDSAYIKHRLEDELTQQFDDHKQLVLRALLKYIDNEGKMLRGNPELTFFGTRTFHVIWEEVCARVFASQRNTRLDKLMNCPKIDYSFINPATGATELIELIKKPEWHVNSTVLYSKDTFEPDYLSFDKTTGGYIYYILDAKYYCPDWSGKIAKNSPGVEDVAKQYMYYLAYKTFLSHHHITDVRNYFLMPKEGGVIEDAGFVKLDIWSGMVPRDIGVRKIPADRLFACYLKNPVQEINLCELL